MERHAYTKPCFCVKLGSQLWTVTQNANHLKSFTECKTELVLQSAKWLSCQQRQKKNNDARSGKSFGTFIAETNREKRKTQHYWAHVWNNYIPGPPKEARLTTPRSEFCKIEHGADRIGEVTRVRIIMNKIVKPWHDERELGDLIWMRMSYLHKCQYVYHKVYSSVCLWNVCSAKIE